MATKVQQLVQLPPLSQSRYEDLACESAYVAKHLEGIRLDSPAAARGSEVHRILATYVNHLCQTKQETDYKYFEELTDFASQEVLDGLGDFCGRYVCNHDQIYGTEVYIALDADFNPTDRAYAIYECTIDVVLLLSATKAKIQDYKTYFQIIDPDTFQSKFYPLLLMCLNPAIDEVEFVLDFTRYGASRSVTYTRGDLPKLKKIAQQNRMRQTALHIAYQKEPNRTEATATPGRQCTYCPRLTGSCPLMQTNPYAEMFPSMRVAFAIWLKQAAKENMRILKDYMIDGGPISYRDANEVEYRAEYLKQERRSYPLGKAFPILNAHLESHPGDRELLDKLTIGGLSSPLKAQKRAKLKDAMQAAAQVNTITKFHVGRPEDQDENGEE